MLYSRVLYDSFMNVSAHKGEILFWVDLNCLSCLKTFIKKKSISKKGLYRFVWAIHGQNL